jgi:hypothetical protein
LIVTLPDLGSSCRASACDFRSWLIWNGSSCHEKSRCFLQYTLQSVDSVLGDAMTIPQRIWSAIVTRRPHCFVANGSGVLPYLSVSRCDFDLLTFHGNSRETRLCRIRSESGTSSFRKALADCPSFGFTELGCDIVFLSCSQ